MTDESPATERSERLAVNRALWDGINAQYTDAKALDAWESPDIDWGIFGRLESELQVLGDVEGMDVVELGCGTAYFSSWLARRGARPVGVDLSPSQLATAARCQATTGLTFPLIEADAEAVPLPDNSFDLAISEYGASLWCDPERWVAEAARLLRPGSRLVFLTNSVLVTLCVPTESGHATEQLQRPQRRVRQIQWPDGGVEFHPAHGDWVQILRNNGFTVEALHELYATDSAKVHEFYDIAMPEWAQQWPVEDLWVARLRD